MKRIIIFLLFALILIFNTNAAANNSYTLKSTPQLLETRNNKSDFNALIKRVFQIRDIDKSNLTFAERQSLRNELRQIRQQLSDPNFTGLYLSSGVIIIILIVLLILALR